MKNGFIKNRYNTIKYVRTYFGLTQNEFAKLIDTPISTLQDWEQGRTTTPSCLKKLMPYLLKDEQLKSEIVMKNPNAFISIPAVTLEIPGTIKSMNIYCDEDAISLSKSWLKGFYYSDIDNLRYAYLSSNSMHPTIHEDSMLLIDTGQTSLLDKEQNIYLFECFNDVRVKRIMRLKGGDFKLLSDNSIYDPIILHRDDPIHPIGKIVGMLSFNPL